MSLDKKIPKNVLIENFPVELAERALQISGEKVLTRAVLSCLLEYFELRNKFSLMKLKAQDLESDLDKVKRYFALEDDLKKQRSELLAWLDDPDRFYLHGD